MFTQENNNCPPCCSFDCRRFTHFVTQMRLFVLSEPAPIKNGPFCISFAFVSQESFKIIQVYHVIKEEAIFCDAFTVLFV